MVRRWRWPPLKFLPSASTGSSSPAGFALTKSSAWASASASHSSSSVASGFLHVRFERIVPVMSDARCGTMATVERSWSSGHSRTSRPSTLTLPDVASYRRGSSCTSVDLPDPVPPMMPRVSPSRTSSVTCASAGCDDPA